MNLINCAGNQAIKVCNSLFQYCVAYCNYHYYPYDDDTVHYSELIDNCICNCSTESNAKYSQLCINSTGNSTLNDIVTIDSGYNNYTKVVVFMFLCIMLIIFLCCCKLCIYTKLVKHNAYRSIDGGILPYTNHATNQNSLQSLPAYNDLKHQQSPDIQSLDNAYQAPPTYEMHTHTIQHQYLQQQQPTLPNTILTPLSTGQYIAYPSDHYYSSYQQTPPITNIIN